MGWLRASGERPQRLLRLESDIVTATIPALMRTATVRHGNRAALRSQVDGAMNYRELDRQVGLVAKALIADGALPGDRTAIWAPNM